MCMEDIRLGRDIKYDEIQYSISTAGNLVLPADPMRVSILFGAPNTGGVSASTDPSIGSNAGINVNSACAGVMLSIKEFGDAVKMAWYLSAAAARTGSILVGRLEQE